MPRRGRRPSNTQSFDEELDETRSEPLFQVIETSDQDDVDGDDVDSSVVVTTQSASTASELDVWEASRSAVQAANASEAWVSQAGESEITDDPVRMYLREIGRVDLLTAEDERVLARSLELEFRLIEIESEISRESGQSPSARVTVLGLLKRLHAESPSRTPSGRPGSRSTW